MNKKIIVAIDSFNKDRAFSIIDELDSGLCMVKIGSIAFNSVGKSLIDHAFKNGFDIFLDLKFHDIPNTVKKSILGIASLPIKMLTIHTSGGAEMMKAAVEGAKDSGIMVFGVTALTSLSDTDSKSIFQRNASSQVDAMLDLAEEAGLDGVVCSPHELKLVKARGCFLSITPGIRLTNSQDDQRRVMSPSEAIKLGADYLVIGRPITDSNDMLKSLKEILQSIQ
jgi:orotidine-5'-phosphate decarboxylase